MQQIGLAFITGLTAGGISCLAVQGGLLASSLAQESDISKKRFATGTFLIAKIISYTLLGALLGAFGSVLQISATAQGWLQVIAGLYMIAVAANLLELHPIFRYTVIQPPRWAFRFIKTESRRKQVGPALFGALTILIPCGITQGMMVSAIASGSPLTGAALLFAFTLGASPVFFILGIAASQLMKQKVFVYATSSLIIVLGIMSVNAGQGLRGSFHTLQNYWTVMTTNPSVKGTAAQINEGKQEVHIKVTTGGYQSDATVLKRGVPVKLVLNSENVVGCSKAFTIPSLKIAKQLPTNGTEEIEFTPTETGRLAFSCSMGMYTGSFQVI